jgi:hypothetical protein
VSAAFVVVAAAGFAGMGVAAWRIGVAYAAAEDAERAADDLEDTRPWPAPR